MRASHSGAALRQWGQGQFGSQAKKSTLKSALSSAGAQSIRALQQQLTGLEDKDLFSLAASSLLV